MTGPGVARRVPVGYQVQVDGLLDHHWSAWFGGLTLTHHSDGTSTLSGPITDQAQLHGVLAKIRDLGVTLLAVGVIEAPGDDHQATGTPAPHRTSTPNQGAHDDQIAEPPRQSSQRRDASPR